MIGSSPSKSITVKRVFGALLVFSAFLYMGHLVAENLEDFKSALLSLSPWQLLGALVSAVVMLLLKALYHAFLCKRLSGGSGVLLDLVPAYCAAQIVRYIPGKIWGVVYQANRLSSSMHLGQVITANAVQTVLTNLLSAGVITSILLAAHLEQLWPLVGIILSIVLVEYIHRTPVLERRLLSLAYRVMRKSAPENLHVLPHRSIGTSVLVLEWIAYFAVWFFVLGGAIGVKETIVLGAWYAAASLFAIAALAVPGGLAVREAIFVALGSFSTQGVAALVVYATALRLILTVAELVCVALVEITRRWFGERVS